MGIDLGGKGGYDRVAIELGWDLNLCGNLTKVIFDRLVIDRGGIQPDGI